MDLHRWESGVCMRGGGHRSQFHLIAAQTSTGAGGSQGAGITSVSLRQLQHCAAGAYISDLAGNICLLRLLVLLLELLLPQAMFPVGVRRSSVSLHVRRCLDAAWVLCKCLSQQNGSLWGFNLWTCASTSHSEYLESGLRI